MRSLLALTAICGLLFGCLTARPPQAPPAQAKQPPARTQPVPEFREVIEGKTPSAIILTYHDMVPQRNSNTLWFDCTPEELQDQIDWLHRRGANFVSLAQIYRYLVYNDPLPSGAVAITFADNYEGFRLHAWPILRERGIPVTMFVHTGHVGSRLNRPKMSWADLRTLEESPLFTVASQTVNHPPDLGALPMEIQKKELKNSWDALYANLRRPAHWIAYPSGKFDARSLQAARETGYLMGFSESQKPVEEAETILAVPRYVHTKYREAWAEANAG